MPGIRMRFSLVSSPFGAQCAAGFNEPSADRFRPPRPLLRSLPLCRNYPTDKLDIDIGISTPDHSPPDHSARP
jgi:hypothetical protein